MQYIIQAHLQDNWTDVGEATSMQEAQSISKTVTNCHDVATRITVVGSTSKIVYAIINQSGRLINIAETKDLAEQYMQGDCRIEEWGVMDK